MTPSRMFLKPNVAPEPLYNQWYAWWYLLAPATAPLFVAHLHLKLMQSFVANPAIHVAALKNPALRGGPYLNHGVERVGEVKQLLERTQKEQARALQFAQAVAELDKLLAPCNGSSLEELYAKVPEPLRGYVELRYDLNNRASARFLEPLLYRAPHFQEASQSVSLRLLEGDARPYIFSTPRLDSQRDTVHVRRPLRHEALDALFAMRRTPGPVEPVREALGIDTPEGQELFSRFFTEQPPRPAPRYDGPGVRARYFGHACVLLETREVSILTDPVLSYDFPTDLPRYTHADLPDRIDYVVITHGHADHLMLETLVQLRERIGTLIVPASGGGLADPSLKLMLQHTGFRRVITLSELETLEVPGGSLTGVPFVGEHSDLDIQAKLAYLVRLGEQSLLMAADSNALEPRMYEHVHALVGDVNVIFLGMESEGGPLSWMYGPLLPAPLPRKMDQSRRLNGCNGERAIDIVKRLHPQQVIIYAMGQEPWLGHVMAMGYTEHSPQLVESRKLMAHCREQGIAATLPYGQAEWRFG